MSQCVCLASCWNYYTISLATKAAGLSKALKRSKWGVNMCKIVLAILATLEVGYVVYLKNTVTATLPIYDTST